MADNPNAMLPVPPSAVEAEALVLSAMMQDKDAALIGFGRVTDEMFFVVTNCKIFRAMTDLFNTGSAIDPLTVMEKARSRNQPEVADAVIDLVNLAPTTAHIEDHCALIEEKFLLRGVLSASNASIKDVHDLGDQSARDVLDHAQARLFDLTGKQRKGTSSWVGDLLWPTFEALEKAQEDGNAISGIRSGFYDLDKMTCGFQPGDLVYLAGRPSMGKAQPLDSNVLMADGTWRFMLHLKVGDAVASPDGEPSSITGIFPQGRMDTYAVTMSDGREVRCSQDHLWEVFHRKWSGAKILTTSEIGDLIERPDYRGRLWVRTVSGDFGGNHDLPIDPWVMGFLLGDGWMHNGCLKFSTSDPDSVQEMKDRLGGLSVIQDKSDKYVFRVKSSDSADIASTRSCLRSIGFEGKRSYEKHIPGQFLAAGRESRTELLAGMIDSDGWVEKDGSICFGTSSKRMALGFEKLVRSLGGLVSFSEMTPSYSYRGEKRVGRVHYKCTVRLPDRTALPLRSRKKERLKKSSRQPRLTFGKVRRVGSDQMQCIRVSHPSNLYITDGFTVTHNTAFAMNVATNLAIETSEPVAIFSLEMTKEQLVHRMLCSEARVDSMAAKRGDLPSESYQRLAAAAGHINKAPIWIDDAASATPLEIKAKARKMASEKGLSLIVVDYIQLMSSGSRKYENAQQETTEISRSLKVMARELGVPVIALSQLSRAPEARQDKKPQLSDLRTSGSLEQDADLVMFMYRPEYYFGDTDKDGNSLEGQADLIVSKQRNGPTGTVKLFFHKAYARFDSVAKG